jgi:hypothetical protein
MLPWLHMFRRYLPPSSEVLSWRWGWKFLRNAGIQSVRVGDKPLETHDQHIFFQLNICGYSPYVTSSLTTGCVWRLQLLLVLASAVILGFESRGTHDHISLCQIRDSPKLEGQVPVFIFPRNSQDYGGGIRICMRSSLYNLGADPQKTPLSLLLRVNSLLQRYVYRTVA